MADLEPEYGDVHDDYQRLAEAEYALHLDAKRERERERLDVPSYTPREPEWLDPDAA